MVSGANELRWSYVGMAVMAVIDLLVAWLVPGPVRLLLLALLLPAQLLAVWLIHRFVLILNGYRTLRESYRQELDFARQVMDSSGQGMVVLDAQGRFSFVNQPAAQALGRPAEQLLGHLPTDFMSAANQAVFQEHLRQRHTGQQSSYTLHVIHDDGSSVPIFIQGTPRWHNGRIVGNFATVTAMSTAPLPTYPADRASAPTSTEA